jgi:hypothetical protein
MRPQFFLTVVFLIAEMAICSFSQTLISGYRTGEYEGQAFNKTANARGKVAFELYALNKSTGQVRAYFIAYDGLQGEAWLTGKISSSGALELSGNLADYRMMIHGNVSDNGSITADYKLEGADTQFGIFKASITKSIPADMADDEAFRASPVSKLIGAWEVGGGLPGQTNPITGMTGVSFVDAHRLEFFPDGSFKHIWSHRHCDGLQCCSEQAMLESGSYSLEGNELSLTTSGGSLINRAVCDPRLNTQTPVKHRTETFRTSMKGSQLCLQQGQQAAACYQKQ